MAAQGPHSYTRTVGTDPIQLHKDCGDRPHTATQGLWGQTPRSCTGSGNRLHRLMLLLLLVRNSLKCGAVWCSISNSIAMCCSVLQCVAVCCSVLQHVSDWGGTKLVVSWTTPNSALQCVAVCCRVLQCVAVCCSVLQCVVVCCRVLQPEV